ncbi:MAG: hypothetical protein JXP34_14165 [Planctomycetes bacterium]|nr:hypothetical protein [Planctomycetota bacterium]
MREDRSRCGRQSGAILIVAFGILTLITLLGVTFASLMRLEKNAALNFTFDQDADLLVDSAVDAAVAELRGGVSYRDFTPFWAPWVFRVTAADTRGRPGLSVGELAAGRLEVEDAAEPSVLGYLLARVDNGNNVYRAKIVDCASQININGDQESLPMILDNLGEALDKAPEIGVNPFWSRYKESGQRIRGLDLILHRRRLEGGQFRTKSELIPIIGLKNYEIVKDFITIKSWVDPNTMAPGDVTRILVEGSVGVGSGIGGVRQKHPYVFGSPSVQEEPRAPVNINTATREVLTAVVAGIQGRRAFPYAEIVHAMFEGAWIPPSGSKPNVREENQLYQDPVWVYFPPLTILQAQRIADQIIAQRKKRPFQCWSAGKPNSGGFEEFVWTLNSSLLPGPQEAVIIQPTRPMNTQPEGAIKGGAGPMAMMWRRGHDNRESSVRRTAGLAYHGMNAWYYDMVKAAIISNFNPNTRLNKGNPSKPAYLPVDKSNLVGVEHPLTSKRSRYEVYPGYTTEFCFDTGGVYEITALGEVTGPINPVTRKPGQIYASKKVRSVVKIYDVLRHTTQEQFEKPFREGQYSSEMGKPFGRTGILSYPMPMVGLTEYATTGSGGDGYLMLAGMVDEQKMRMPEATRNTYYQSFQNVLLSHGFFDRDPQSKGKIRQLARSGALLTYFEQIGEGNITARDLLADIWDPEYARDRRLRYRYNLQRLGGLINVDDPGAPAEERRITEPRVGSTQTYSSNLMPDGIHNSILETNASGAGFLLLPASQLRERSNPAGAMGRMYANETGSVPYYQGGVVFWVKFDFDGYDPVFSGLVGCTQVQTDVSPDLKGSEGNQFYIFKNTMGQLRVVRMYYHQAFPSPSAGDTPLPVIPEEGALSKGDAETQMIELDEQKTWARSDVVVNVENWKAHEWHHVGVFWDDRNTAPDRVRVFLDFEPAITQTQAMPTAMGEEDFVTLNVHRPVDELYVCGFIRHQARSGAGLFKFPTNVNMDGAVMGPKIKRVLANATMDEFLVLNGTFEIVRRTLGRQPGYYTNQNATYANLFEIPVPSNVETVLLRAFTWTEYHSPFYWSASAPLSLEAGRVQCEVQADQRITMTGPWKETGNFAANDMAGRSLTVRSRQGDVGRTAKLIYRFSMSAGRARGGHYGMAPVSSPVIDDVTVSYFLPTPQVLIREEEL